MKFLDLFSGIGGFRLGLERAGHECIGFCEIDRFARDSYKAIHGTEGELELHDITAVSDDDFRLLRGKVDIIAGGFPCQSFSIAGKREGFANKTKGTLFFEIARAAKQIQPQLLFLENVKGLLNHDKGNTFRTILSTLDELGYDAEWQLLNSKDFGVPQNRERVFIIGHLRNGSGREVFPIQGNYRSSNRGHKLETELFNSTKNGDAYCITTRTSQNYLPKHIESGKASLVKVREATKKGYSIAEKGDSINFEHPNSKTRRGRVGKGVANTLTTSCNQGTLENFRIRKLTPKECWRLQGFPDWAFDKAAEVNSDSQLYKQAGNSVTVNVIEAIATKF